MSELTVLALDICCGGCVTNETNIVDLMLGLGKDFNAIGDVFQ